MTGGGRNTRDKVTLRDVAEAAGVHPGTASRALNDEKRELVNPATADRVLAVAAELGYRPNPIARGLKTSRSHTVGVLVPDLTNPLFPPIVRGIQDRLASSGYTPLIANTDNDAERERADIDAMRARQVDGIITATARRGGGALSELVGSEIPVVQVNRHVEDGALSWVAGDDTAGIRLAVEHLVSMGHYRIGHLAGPQDLSTGKLRLEAFHEAIQEAGIEPDPELTLVGKAFVESEGRQLCAQLLDRGHDISAVVAGNDLMALGCYAALAERRLKCPSDLSVVGFNDMPFAAWFAPPLTTVRIPHYEMGRRSAELLLRSLVESETEPSEILLAPELVVRGSTDVRR